MKVSGNRKSRIAAARPPADSLKRPQAVGRPNPVEFVFGEPGKAAYWVCKRVFDLVAASALLLILGPLMLLIAVLIKLDSSGPAFYRQERVGSTRRRRRTGTLWNIVTFQFYKFRTMYANTDTSLHRLYIANYCRAKKDAENTAGGVFKLKNDPRVTAIGRILRKSSLDELPQLYNVLKGEMSLVGPRPVPTYEVMHYSKQHKRRFAAVPGITGLWQVRGRGRVPFEEMIRMDVEYTERCSLLLDLKILLQTIPAVLFARGAE